MEIVTKKDIDTLKDYMSSHREQLSDEELTQMENEFIEKVKTYKYLYPHHTKTLTRWRNWYRMVKNDLHKKYIPQEELGILQYHLETFRMKDSDYAIGKLQNWIDRMTASGYKFNDEVVLQINSTIDRFGYTFQPEER